MTAHRLSASSVHLARHCLHSFREDVPVPADKPGPAAKKGTGFHLVVESYLSDGVYPETADASFGLFSAWLDWWDRSPVSRHPVRAELGLVLNAETGTVREIAHAGHRDYGEIDEDEIPMTIDLAADSGERAIVFDWKTGRPGDPCEAQLMTNAVAWALHAGRFSARAQAVYVTDVGVIEAEPLRLDALDLDAHRATLRRMLRRLPTAEPVPGPHCKGHYCRIRETCKSHRAWLKEQP